MKSFLVVLGVSLIPVVLGGLISIFKSIPSAPEGYEEEGKGFSYGKNPNA